MGLLDFILKKRKNKLTPITEAIERLEELKQEETKEFNVFTKKQELKTKTEETLAALNALKNIKLNAKNHHSKIAEEFKTEYVSNIRIALTPLLDLSGEYRYKASQGVGKALKLTVENQYFPQYYPTTAGKVVVKLRELENAFRELRIEEEKVEAKAAPFKHALKKIREYAKTIESLKNNTKQYSKLSELINEKREEHSLLSNKKQKSVALTNADKIILQEHIIIEKTRAKIKTIIQPLNPAFTALLKTGVIEAKQFSLNGVEALIEKGKPAYDELLRTLEEKTNEVGDTAVRAIVHANSVDEELNELLITLASATAAKKEAERNSLPLKALNDELNRTQLELNEATTKLNELTRELKQLVEKVRVLKGESEALTTNALGEKIEFTTSN